MSTKIVKLPENAGCNGQLFVPLLKIYSPFFIEDDLALAYEIDLFLGQSAGPMATGFFIFLGKQIFAPLSADTPFT